VPKWAELSIDSPLAQTKPREFLGWGKARSCSSVRDSIRPFVVEMKYLVRGFSQ